MRPHPRGAQTSPSDPRAWATCDRCGFVVNHYKLSWQYEWAGTRLTNLGILTCDRCTDEPNRQLGTIIIPPDPMPILNARVEQYNIDEYPVSELAGEDGVVLCLEDMTPYPVQIIVDVQGNIAP